MIAMTVESQKSVGTMNKRQLEIPVNPAVHLLLERVDEARRRAGRIRGDGLRADTQGGS